MQAIFAWECSSSNGYFCAELDLGPQIKGHMITLQPKPILSYNCADADEYIERIRQITTKKGDQRDAEVITEI